MARPTRKDIDYKYNLKIYWELLKKHKWLAIGLTFVVVVMEGLQVADKFLFKAIIDNGTEFAAGSILASEFVRVLIIVAVIFGSLIATRAVGRWTRIHLLNRLTCRLMCDVKQKFFNHIIHLSHNFHTTNKTGSLISRLIRGGHTVDRLTNVFIWRFAPLAIQIIIVGASLIYFNISSALVALLIAVSFISVSVAIEKKRQDYALAENDAEDTEKANISDMLTNIDSIKYFGKETRVKQIFLKFLKATKAAQVKHWDFFKRSDVIQGIIVGVGMFFIMYFPIIEFLNGETTLGTITFIFTVYGNLVFPLYNFMGGIRGYYRAMADFESLTRYAKIENDIKDKPNAEELAIKKGIIEFKDVTFKYPKHKKLFEDFSLSIKHNEKVALVGHSGCGKSTLVKLLYRLYDLKKGEILIDGEDIRNFKQESLRSELSIVPQECILFDDTLYNNIAFSRPSAQREEVRKAMKFAQLDEFIADLPKGEKTIVGERGVKLSGGEKQRVSIARAILADRKVLVLDEATSSLDSKTEHEIQKDLQELMKGRTSIIIAHRLSTIMSADKIVVLEKGKIVQMGTHNQLIRKKGVYKELWNLQKGGYIK